MERNPQRRLNSALPMSSLKTDTLPAAPPRAPQTVDARAGSAKVVTEPKVNGNLKRQQVGEIGYHGGVTVDDLPNTVKTYTGSIPLHPATPDAQRAKLDKSNDASAVLADASRFGRPPEKA